MIQVELQSTCKTEAQNAGGGTGIREDPSSVVAHGAVY